MDLQPQFAEFIGKEVSGIFVGKSYSSKYFYILILNDFSSEDGKKIVDIFNHELNQKSINKLSELDEVLNALTKTSNLPLGFTLVCGYLQGDLLWLKTIGDGVVILQRGRTCDVLMSGDNSASGYLEDHDRLIFTNKTLLEKFTLAGISRSSIGKSTSTLLSELKINDENTSQNGAIALIVDVEKQVNEIITATELSTPQFEKHQIASPTYKQSFNIGQKISSVLELIKTPKKNVTLIILAVLILVLIWSVGLGVKRRKDENNKKTIVAVEKLVNEKLLASEDAAFLDLPKAQELIKEARQETEALNNLPENYQKSIDAINNKIKSTEEKILKKEEKPTEEFYDLKLENEEASADTMVLDKDLALLSDQKNKKIYRLSLTKKKFDKFNTDTVGLVSRIAIYDNGIYLLNSQSGVFKSNDTGTFKKVIEKDKDWGSIKNLSVYNGNIYLLDTDKDEVYKYLVAEGGYSDKKSYFGSGESIDLKEASSLSIDSALYIGFPDFITKYSAGVREEFKTSYPDSNIKLEKVFTSVDLEKVYGWDKSKGVIYVLGKNGTYEKQIGASILKTASDFVVFENNAYILKENKIYKMGVE